MRPIELAYIGVEVAERKLLNDFFNEVVGLMPEHPSDSTSRWRNDEKAWRIQVTDGSSNDAAFFGVEHPADDFDAAVERLVAAGVNVTEGTPDELENRAVTRLVHAPTPWGPRVEIVSGLANSSTPFHSALVPDGFHTDGVGLGHIVFQLPTEDKLTEAHEFATEVLGFRQSDWYEGTHGENRVVAKFYHCNERHHTLALACVPGNPTVALNHIMVEARSEVSVGKAYDRAVKAGTKLDRGLGRHDNDQMFSFYAWTPSGFRVEFGYGAREITEPWDGNRRYDRESIWGHQHIG